MYLSDTNDLGEHLEERKDRWRESEGRKWGKVDERWRERNDERW